MYFHLDDFLKVLNTVEKPNLKLQSVKSDLESPVVLAFLQCLGLFYLKVTGPYWNITTSGQVKYFELHKYVQALHLFLKQCVESPEILLENSPWIDHKNEVETVHQYKKFAVCVK